MAKSLLGKADSTLAAMSLKESMADVMPDYSDIYKTEAEGFKENLTAFQKTVGDYFDNLNADNNALADELKEAVSTTMANMSMGEVPDEAGMELFNTELNKLRQRLNNTSPTKKGELERAKIRAEMERLKNSTDGMSNTLIDLGVRVENGDFIPNATGSKNMEILKAINNRTAKREIINGDLVYSIPGFDKKITQQDLRKMLVSNDPNINKAVNAITTKAGAFGKTKGMKWEDNRQEIVNGYRESLSTRSGLAANMHQPQGPLKYSFADYLSGKGDKKYNAQIWNALKEAGVNVPEDKDGDGKITEKDFATPENGIAMIKRLTQIDDDGFDLAGTKNIVSEFLADHVGKKEFDDNRSVIETPKELSVSDQMKIRAQNLREKEFLLKQQNPDATERNKEFQLFLEKTDEGNVYEKTKASSTDLVNLDTQLINLMNQNSFDTENYVNLFGKKIGYFPGKGFAPVEIRDDGQLTREQLTSTKAPKGGFWKTPQDVFQNYSIPTTYSKKQFYEGQKETHKSGRPIIFKGGKWVYNDKTK